MRTGKRAEDCTRFVTRKRRVFMKYKHLFTLAMFFVVASVHAQVNSLPSQPHLLVKGQAERVVVPDRFKVNLSLQRVDSSPCLLYTSRCV